MRNFVSRHTYWQEKLARTSPTVLADSPEIVNDHEADIESVDSSIHLPLSIAHRLVRNATPIVWTAAGRSSKRVPQEQIAAAVRAPVHTPTKYEFCD